MKRVLLIVLTMPHLAGSASAIPPHDECDGAISITGFGDFAFDSTDATASEGYVGFCSNSVDDYDTEFAADVWYLWTTPPNWQFGSIVVSTCGQTTVDTVVAFYDSACSFVEEGPLECDDDGCAYQSRLSWQWVLPGAYAIRIGTRPGLSGGAGHFRILPGELEEPVYPQSLGCPSDAQPSPAVALETCNARDRFDAINSTRRQFVVADDFIPAESGTLQSLCWWGTYLRNGVECQRGLVDFFEITYYADDCGAPGEIIAGPFSQEDAVIDVLGTFESNLAYPNLALEYQFSTWHDPVAVQGGSRYWIAITNSLYDNCAWHWGTASGHAGYAIQTDDRDDTMTSIPTDLAFCFRIVETDGPVCEENPPANDDCADAIPLTDVVAFDTYGATTDGPINVPAYSPGPTACDFPLGDEQVHRDIWYTFDAQCTSTLRLSTCESEFDTKLAVYEGLACPPTPAIACNDDACGGDLARQSQVQFQTRADRSYLIRLGGYSGAFGQGILTFELAPPARTSLRDFALFSRCFEGATEFCCSAQDFNTDGTVDLDDLPAFHQTFVGP